MKYFIHIVLTVFLFCLTSGYSFGQDAFKSKVKKGPNIYSPKGPKGKSKTQRYQQGVSKKKSKRKNAAFSSKKKRHGTVVGGGKKKQKGDKNFGGRKSTKGRKSKNKENKE